MNREMPLDVFAKICVKEVLFLRKKVKELTEEKNTLQTALTNAMENPPKKKVASSVLEQQVEQLKAENTLLRREQHLEDYKKQISRLKKHIAKLISDYTTVEINEEPHKVAEVINLAYLAGYSDKDFNPASAENSLRKFLKKDNK